MTRRRTRYTIGTARYDPPTPANEPSLLVTFLMAALIPVALVAASYPVQTATLAVVVAAAALLWQGAAAALRRLADRHARLHVPGLDVDVAFSRAR